MKRRFRVLGATLLATAVAGVACAVLRRADGPIGWLPGGAFRGEGRACPSSGWQAFADVAEVELEVRPASPRSVTTWSVVHDDQMYIPADFLTPFKRWPQQVGGEPRVRLRIEGGIYECALIRERAPEVVARLRRAVAEKYQLSEDGLAARTEVWWFRVDP